MTEEERIARASIAKTLGECTQAGDARKAEPYSLCFTEDGVLDLGDRLEGRAAIRRWMEAPSVIRQSGRPSPGFVSHHLTTCRIEFVSDTSATVRTYFLVTTAIGLDHNGYYDDRFRKSRQSVAHSLSSSTHIVEESRNPHRVMAQCLRVCTGRSGACSTAAIRAANEGSKRRVAGVMGRVLR